MVDLDWSLLDNPVPKERGPWERFKDAYLGAAVDSEMGGAATIVRQKLLRDGYSEEAINQKFRELREEKTRKATADPMIKGEGLDRISPANLGRGVVDLVGGVLGGVDPTYVLAPGRSAVTRILSQGGINAAADAGSQGIQIKKKIRDEYDPVQTGFNAAAGVGFQGMAEVARLAKQFGRVTSIKRTPERNKKVGGVANSHHLTGRAIDIARGKDVSHADIVAEYKRRGFNIIEALDEGDHTHLAFRFDGKGKSQGPDELGEVRLAQNEQPDPAMQQAINDALAPPRDEPDPNAGLIDDLMRQADNDQGDLPITRAELEDMPVKMRDELLARQDDNVVDFDQDGVFSTLRRTDREIEEREQLIASGKFRDPVQDLQTGEWRERSINPKGDDGYDFLNSEASLRKGASHVDPAQMTPRDNYHEKFTPYEPTPRPADAANDVPSADDLRLQKKLEELHKEDELKAIRKKAFEDASNKLEGSGPNYTKALLKQQGKEGRVLTTEQVEAGVKAADEATKTYWERLLQIAKELLADDGGSYRGPGFDEGRTGLDPADPESRLISDLQNFKPAVGAQRSAYRQERAQRAGRLDKLQQEGGGRENLFAQLKSLKGELPKVDYESVAKNYSEEDIVTLFNKINHSPALLPYERTSALTALNDLLEGKLPTPSEIRLLSEVYSPEFIQAILSNRDVMSKFWSAVGNTINVPRAVMSSMDFSAPFRQGIGFVGKMAFWKNIPSMLKLFRSEEASKAALFAIKSHPNWEKAKRGGLAILDPHSHYLADRTEDFMGDFAEKIPVVGLGVSASNRAFTGYLNKLRFDVFNDLLSKYEKAGLAPDDKKLKEIANFVNNFSGRGNLGVRGNAAAPLLSAGLFSPRLIASRVHMLNPYNLLKADPILRKEAWKSVLSYSAYVGSILAVGSAGLGWTVEKDMRSPDFGKLKDGDTRVDVSGGIQPYVRLIAQIASRSKVTGSGKERELGGGFNGPPKGPYDESIADVVGRFARSKESPVASLLHNFFAGENIVGEKFTRTRDVAGVKVPEEVLERVVPMTLNDLSEIAEDEGFMKAISLAPGAFMGHSVQNYEQREPKKKKDKNDLDWSMLDDPKMPEAEMIDWDLIK